MNRRWSAPDADACSPIWPILAKKTQRPLQQCLALAPHLDRLLHHRRAMEDALVLGDYRQLLGGNRRSRGSRRRVCPQLVRDGELIVSVDHPAWATGAPKLAGPVVLGRLSEKLGDMAPKRLSVRVTPSSRR